MPEPEWLRSLAPDRRSPLSLGRQLYLALYEAIVRGELPRGAALPPSRALATRLGLARNTVVAAYAQLGDEGLVRGGGRRGTMVTHSAVVSDRAPGGAAADGAGTVVGVRSEATVEDAVGAIGSLGAELPPAASRSSRALSSRALGFAAFSERHRAFAPGEPDPSLFPARHWQRAMARVARLPADELGYRDRASRRLREAIARYLAVYRSVVVDPARIVVTSGTRQSLLLAAALFADPDDVAWVETPGYRGAIDAFRAQGLRLHACAVDVDGAVPPDAPPPRLAYLTPCYQYPLGMPLSAERREAFLALSARHGTVLFEDDYDSEFRDDAQPRPALAASAAARGACVLHAGTFSKLIFPAARVAWLVVPDGLSERAGHALRALGGGHGTLAQGVVAELLDTGVLSRHLQRARQVYARRRRVLLGCVARSGRWRLVGGGALSAVISLDQEPPLAALEAALADERLGAVPLERFVTPDRVATERNASAPTTAEPTRSSRLVLGLGNVDSLALPGMFERLERAVQRAARHDP